MSVDRPTPRRIVVLARRDPSEAMRSAAGLTIFGHEVALIFVAGPVADTPENARLVQLLDETGIAPLTTVPEMADELPLLDSAALGRALVQAEAVINL